MDSNNKYRIIRIVILSIVLICGVLFWFIDNIYLKCMILIPPFIFLYFFIRTKRKMHIITNANKIATHLQQDCNPALYVEAYENYDKRYGTLKELHWVIQCNLGLGYFHMGNTKHAIDILNRITYEDEQVVENDTLIMAHRNLCHIHLFLNNPQKVEFHQKEMNYFLSVSDPDYKTKSLYYIINKSIYAGLNILDKTKSSYLKEELHIYQEDYEFSSNLLGRINAQYWIFKIHERLGNLEQQAVCMKYIKENGGQLFLVDLAKKWLKEH